MDNSSIVKNLQVENMSHDEQMALLDSIQQTIKNSKVKQKERANSNAQLVVQALKKIKQDVETRFDELNQNLEEKGNQIVKGAQGVAGRDGKDGKDGKQGINGFNGRDGKDGKDGQDGVDGVSVIDAKIDFDGSLVITLSTGKELNVGEVVAPEIAEKIKLVTSGGAGTVLPNQSGNSGKYLQTDGSVLSWASVAGGLSYQGTWNATSNTPTLASGTGTNGYYYIVATAGSTALDGITDWQIGDWLMFNGSVWQKIDQSNLVTSVNGQTGAVSVGTVTSVAATAGTGISITGSPIITSGTLNITNSAPDQTVVLTASTGISTSGTYPNFTITNSAPDQTVALTAGTGISTSGTYPNFTITNSAPDQTVALTGAGTTSITGTYPNFTITSNDSATGTVTSVAELTLGTTGTDLSSTVANGTTTPVITLNVPTASATNRGALSSADWTTFNNKGSGTVTSVTGTSPVDSSGGTTPAISLATGYGDTKNPYASKTAKYVLAAPNGADGLPTFRAIVASDIPTLNQNTTGSAATLTTARTIAITGDLAYTSGSFDGSGNVTGAGTLATVNTNVGSFTYASLTVNGKGLITAASNGTAPVTSVTGTAPVVSSGGATPAISMAAATASVNGYLTSTDWSTFNGKGSGTVTSVAATVPSFLSVAGSPITTTGTLAITLSGTALPIANGGTGATTLAGASIATYSGTETLTNKRIDPRVTSAASASSLTPDISVSDVYAYTALAAGLTINAPNGTPLDGDKLIFRLLDNGTGRALTWNATYTVIGVTLPTTTTANKTTYVGCIYNANNTRWDVIAVTTQA